MRSLRWVGLRRVGLILAAALVSSALPLAVRADDEALRGRLEALGTVAESETDLAAAVEAALARASVDRARGDEAASVRAERIAEATLALLERRRARADAAERLHAAELEREEMRRRLADARAAAASDARERERLAPPGTAP